MIDIFSRPQVFVFGSNQAGRHGKGSALEARLHHGAIPGMGEGVQGHSYAIPTKDAELNILPPHTIQAAVWRFLAHAIERPEIDYNVVAIGCGLAGYSPKQIGPMFVGAPSNVKLPDEFKEWAQV